jgi:hypothetical protein
MDLDDGKGHGPDGVHLYDYKQILDDFCFS